MGSEKGSDRCEGAPRKGKVVGGCLQAILRETGTEGGEPIYPRGRKWRDRRPEEVFRKGLTRSGRGKKGLSST